MVHKKVFALLVVGVSLFVVTGCPTDVPTAMITGSLGLNINSGSPAPGGAEYHVLLFGPDAVVDLDDLLNPAPDFSMSATLPGGVEASYNMIHYFMADVPAGDFFVMAWVDVNGTPGFDHYEDFFGFFAWDPNNLNNPETVQPPAPNVNVPATGVIDVDFNLTVLGA